MGAIIYYQINKWWFKSKKNKKESSYENFTFMILFKNWSIIIILTLFN